MIRSVLLKKIGYKVLSVTCPNGLYANINNVRIKLPVNYFRLYTEDYEKDNFEFIKGNVHEGDVVLDIGAHIGLMAVLFGKLVKKSGKVFSFEPTPESYSNLCETIRINKLRENVIPVNMPVTDKSGMVNFFISDNHVDVANTLAPWEEGKKLNTLAIQATSVDDFVASQKLDKVDFIKIDAEGAELNVLKGAAATIKQFHPKMNLALHPAAIIANNDSLGQIYDFVANAGYKVVLENRVLAKTDFCNREKLFDVHLLYNS